MAEKSSELTNINEPDAVSTTAGASQDSYLESRSDDYTVSDSGMSGDLSATDDGTAETEQIREKIEETRSNMSETLDAIQEKLSISNISEQVKEQVSEHISSAIETAKGSVYDATLGKVGNFMETLSKTNAGKVARDNPLPLVLIGLGIGLLAYQNAYGSKRRTYRYDDYEGEDKQFYRGRTSSGASTLKSAQGRIGDVAGSAFNSVSGAASSAIGSVGDVAGSAYEGVTSAASGAVSGVSNVASSAYSGVTSVASSAYETVGGLGSQAREQYDYYIDENPLAVGAVALAIGAAVGMSIPSTRYEGQLLGETRDNLLAKAQDAAGDLVDKVKQVAGEAQKTLTDEVKNAAGEVQKTVTDQAKAQGLTGDSSSEGGKTGGSLTGTSPGISPNPVPGTNPKM
ncbi:MAG TPA: DUF3618 domain-containing protein [Pyrinomonadaceae bacterium]|jgi:ElaB/YqjD/DUF883 family membrane-anchored ribosome-binding protein